jgi:hypothetical protein
LRSAAQPGDPRQGICDAGGQRVVPGLSLPNAHPDVEVLRPVPRRQSWPNPRAVRASLGHRPLRAPLGCPAPEPSPNAVWRPDHHRGAHRSAPA